ncbi:MAG: hypothetical protein IBX68_03905 [Dehalococcoidia bacterium]|nr:hypothetical protein [Dehalococcoidia bacterium]
MDSKERTLGMRGSIFRKTDRVIPELGQPVEAVQQIEPAAAEPKPAKPQRIKATFYLNPEDILAIDEVQSNEFRRTGKKPERSQIVSQAIQQFRCQNG